MKLEQYKDLSGGGGITAYKILEEGIIIEFQHKDLYLYDYVKPGKHHVEQMKILAGKGKGLTTYINQNIRNNYGRKLN
jgi:hypothetical protein